MFGSKLGTINPKKHQSFYRYFHPYFTRLPPNVVTEYIRFFTKLGNTVLDPFCGSGTVGIEAILAGRRTICSDLSPLATFITKELINSTISIRDLEEHFHTIREKCQPPINKIWSYGSSKVYFTNNIFFETLKKKYWYPKQSLSYRSNISTVEKLYDIRQLLSYAIIFDSIRDIKVPSIQNTFLIVFFGTMARVNLTYMVSNSRGGTILHNGGSSIFQFYDYRLPKHPIVIPIWTRFERKFEDVKRIKKTTIDLFSSVDQKIISQSKVFRLDAAKLEQKLKLNSVDYIFTDPPYGGKIPYLELTSMWAAWMGWKISRSDLKSEIIEKGELNKTQREYICLMQSSIKSMSKVLKVGGMLSIVYQHDNLNVWKSLLEAAKENGLSFEYSSIQPTNSSSIIKKKFKGEIISVPLIINFKKEHMKGRTYAERNKRQLIFEFEIEKQIELLLKNTKIKPTYEDVHNVVTKILFDLDFVFNLEVISTAVNKILQKFGVQELFKLKIKTN